MGCARKAYAELIHREQAPAASIAVFHAGSAARGGPAVCAVAPRNDIGIAHSIALAADLLFWLIYRVRERLGFGARPEEWGPPFAPCTQLAF